MMTDATLQEIEQRLIRDCYPVVLGDCRVGPGDDFFVLGGDSLGMIRLFSVVQDVFGVEVPAREFFTEPTLRTLAEAVRHTMASAS
jgi:acyl carrier protein